MPIYRRSGSAHLWVRGSIAGRKYRQSSGTADPRKAEEFEHIIRDRLWRRHALGDKGAVSIREAAQRWLATLKNKTRAQDEANMQRLLMIPRLADSNIGAISFEVNERIQADLLLDGKAPGTVDRYMACWRRFLRKCSLEWGMMPMPPKVPMLNAEKPESRWLTPDEYRRLKDKLPRHLAVCADFAVHTGLRMRAQLSLKWSQVDLRTKRAWIAGSSMKAGKTHGFPLSPPAVKALKDAHRFQAEQDAEHQARCERLKIPYVPHPKEYVFTWKGKPLDDCNTKAFQNALAAAGIEGANWHTFRHTFASWAVQRGVTLQELMLLGPWESYEMVLNYGHLAQDNLAGAVEKIAKMGATRSQKSTAGVRSGHRAKKSQKGKTA